MGRRRRGRAVHGILLVDKPSGVSSNAVLQRVRRALGAAKAGHAGTLDPLATGMLPVLLGEATKFASYLISSHKAYEATLRLGIETDSLDADGSVVRERVVPSLQLSDVVAVAATFRGEQQQVPPMVSAIKVNGERLYKVAREGREVERKARTIVVDAFEILETSLPDVRIRVRCSKGTYIRVLGSDLGEALGCGAHVTALRRSWVAPFDGCAMHSPEVVEAEGDALLLPLDAGIRHLPSVHLDASVLQPFRHGHAVLSTPVLNESVAAVENASSAICGGSVSTEDAPVAMPIRVYGPDGRIVGLGVEAGVEARRGGGVACADAPIHIRPIKVLQLDGRVAGDSTAS